MSSLERFVYGWKIFEEISIFVLGWVGVVRVGGGDKAAVGELVSVNGVGDLEHLLMRVTPFGSGLFSLVILNSHRQGCMANQGVGVGRGGWMLEPHGHKIDP